MTTFNAQSVMMKVFLLLVTPLALSGPLSFSIEFVSYRDEMLPEYYKSASFGLSNYSKDNPRTFGGCFVFAKDIKQVELSLTVKYTKNMGKIGNLGNIKVDCCKLLGEGMRRSLAQVIAAAMTKTNPKMPQRCPLTKDTEYCYENFSLSSIKFPSIVPPMNITAIFQFTHEKATYYKGYFGVQIGGRK